MTRKELQKRLDDALYCLAAYVHDEDRYLGSDGNHEPYCIATDIGMVARSLTKDIRAKARAEHDAVMKMIEEDLRK